LKAFYSIKDAAEYLGVEYKTVWRLVRSGELPSGKIGGVYRIRKEDIDAFFERSTPRAAVEGLKETIPVGICACCGRQIVGELERGGNCGVCGAALCSSCWLLEGRRVCMEHAEKAPSPATTGATAPAPEALPLRCSRCLRVLPGGRVAGTCQAAGCSEPICSACWSDPDQRFCTLHLPSQEQKLAAARQALAAGTSARLVMSVDAKKAELAFIGRVDQKVRGITTIRNPLDGTLYRMAAWDKAYEAGDQVPQLLDIRKVGFLDKVVADVLPMNLWVRYTVLSREAPRGQGLSLEARCVARLAAFAADGFDEEPSTLPELLPTLQAAAGQAEESRRPHILALASPTGWDAEAMGYISADVSGKSYSHRFLLPCLVDLLSGTLTYNELDERIQPFVSLFAARLEGEDLQRVATYVREYLAVNSGLPVREIADAIGVSQETVQKAIARLQAEGLYGIEQIRGIGPVLVRRKDS
jgi:excisionase family DNA binding protein